MGVLVQGLRKSFDRTPVVDDLTFEVPDGKLLTVLGPSGSGKTTLLRCIAGVETPEKGTIRIGDRVVYDAATGVNVPTEDRGIGMVFQSNALWPHMTVRGNVAYPLEVRRDPEVDAKVKEVLALLKMDGLAARYPSEISGGEQQRVAIARAIVYRPSLVLLDEPFSNLDVLLRESLRDELKQLQHRVGISMVYVTHDRVDALSLGDQLAVMNGGRLVAYGPPDSLLRFPPDSYTAKFLGGMLSLEGDAAPVSEGVVRVRTRHGTFDIPASGKSGKVKLCVPPSACEVLAEGNGAGLPGTVAGIARFPSGYVGVRVSTEDGTVEVHSDSGATFSVGARVRVIFDPRLCIILQD